MLSILKNVSILIFIGLILTSCTDKSEEKPNIIFILTDDLGYGDVSCLNSEAKVVTPNIDELAQGGIIFTDAHSASSVCTPSRYGLLTGRYCWRTQLKKHVLQTWDGPLIEQERLTIGKFLKQNGYNTACIGKWHLGWDWQSKDGSKMSDYGKLGDNTCKNVRIQFGGKIDFTKPINNGPVTKGFDYYFGDDVPNFPPYCFIENDRVLQIPSIEKPDTIFGTPGPMAKGWKLENVMPTITDKAVSYIKALPGDGTFKKEKGKPFFLYLALTAPHTPIAPDNSFQGTSKAGLYGDYVQEADWAVGEILKALKEENMEDNTLVFFSSDNGSPGRDGTNMAGKIRSVNRFGHNPSYIFKGIKTDAWEGGHHVPLIARWPHKIKQGTVSDQLVCLTDFMATCASILNKPLPKDAAEDSYSILPVLTGGKATSVLRG